MHYNILLTIAFVYPLFYRALRGIDFIKTTAAKAFTNDELHSYYGFLFLSFQYPDHHLIPTPEIDAVLHAHVVNPCFIQDCQKLFGDRERVHVSGVVNQEAFQKTKALFEKMFQVPYGDTMADCEFFRRQSGEDG
jgi:hypothetical protein